ncbi:BTAD domain-containing putative transcriptional regulator [Pseudonocardia yunnanensis]|uniref:ATP-binding protein n=1 Tax=Pseudonocardia yunnanensis TaxID=58107 RepID=A0ABW4ESS9_9PSEU
MELILLSRVAFRGQEISSPRIRALIALLADDLRTGSSTSRLVNGLWPEEQPENPTKALQVLVSRARAQLGTEVILSTPTGYRLSLGEEQVDASAVRLHAAASAQHSRDGDHATALAEAQAGLGLWDGAGDGVPADPVSALRTELIPAHRSLARTRALALSRLGRHAEALDGLTGLLREQPRDEEVLLELLRCEAATAGPSAALTRYDAYRRGLRDELGSDPGAPLQALYDQLLQGAAPQVRRGVVHEPNPLLGRDDDVTAVQALIRTSRVTSIVGPGGLGKTRLANVVSRRAEQRVVHVVGLAGVTSDDDVAAEVASALEADETRRRALGYHALHPDLLSSLLTSLGTGPTLLVLDNCEHVLDGAAELVQTLVAMTGELRVLTTSRAPLGLSSESVYALPELDLPTTVELFRRRARAARPGVDLPAEAVTELCRHLDGLPLAVELAAARVRVLSVAQIAGRLEDRFALLRGGPRDAPQRHRTLHAVVGWSWNLLDPAAQAAMRTLSIFPDGFGAEAAQHLLDDDDALTVLEDLVEQSLLKVVDTAMGTRFRMLETVREFSAARREEADEDAHAVTRFLAWACDFGVAQHESPFGADPIGAAARIRTEQDNLLQAIRLGLARDDGATVAAAAAVLAVLWLVESNHGRLTALTEETSWILSHFHPAPELVEVTRTAAAISAAGTFMMEGLRAVRPLVVLRRLPPARPDTPARAVAALLLQARQLADHTVLDAFCADPEPCLAGIASGVAAYLRDHEGDRPGAIAAAEGMLVAFDGPATPWLRAMAHARLCELLMQEERAPEVRHHLEEAKLLEELGLFEDGIRWSRVIADLQLGDVDEAERSWKEASSDMTEEAAPPFREDLATHAEILLMRGEVDAGLELWRCTVERLREAGGEPIGLGPWLAEILATTVVAHAQHGRLDLVEEITAELPRTLTTMLAHRTDPQPTYYVELAVHGALLLALGMVDIDRGRRSGDRDATASGVRLVALAERFHFVRTFQPTMSSVRARTAAEQADAAGYADAVAAFAGLDRDELQATALRVLAERP